MKELCVEVFSDVGLDGKVDVPLETLIVLFALKFCDQPRLLLNLVETPPRKEKVFTVNLNYVLFEVMPRNEICHPADLCALPVVVTPKSATCVAGLCSVIRHIFKSVDPVHPYLGFKQSCLYACAEVSLWTKFCEVDCLRAVEEIVKLAVDGKDVFVPKDLLRFEMHMAQPVRTHNIQKVKQDLARAVGGIQHSIPDSRLQMTPDLEHQFAEGAQPTLADIILFPCLHIVFTLINTLEKHLPLAYRWYQSMLQVDMIGEALQLVTGPERRDIGQLIIPIVPATSLYKSDPRRYKPKHRIFTRQEDIDASLDTVRDFQMDMVSLETYGADVDFDWEAVPWDARPEGGALPSKRIQRKSQQLENLARAVLKIAKEEDKIVDFCAGSGHLGLILAHSLPRCTIILLENKEESLGRARERASKLHLSNIVFCQSNVDYFVGKFDVGVSLHACGVATDLVMEKCLKQGAAFVCCPCCYGSMQPNHMVQYPRSEYMRNLPLSQQNYLVLGHAADQTHDEQNAKTEQGMTCMTVIDADRCWKAREAGYKVSLTKLSPPSCTPKNHLLVGVQH